MTDEIPEIPEIPDKIANADIAYVAALLRDIHFELAKSASADQVDGFQNQADMVRLEDFIGDLDTKFKFFASTAVMDYPKTHGIAYFDYPKFKEVAEPSNRDVVYILRKIEMMHREWGMCDSSRNANSIGVHDAARGISYIETLQALINDYIKPRTPNDYPETTPRMPAVGPGN